MKFTRMALLATALAPALSLAASAQPLLSKTNYPGFVAPWTLRTESCKVYSDRVEIQRGFGYQQNGSGFGVTETRPLKIDGDLRQVIKAASQEATTQQENGLCDGPSTVVSAQVSEEANAEPLVLFTSGGCGSPRVERKGNATQALRDLVDLYCPEGVK